VPEAEADRTITTGREAGYDLIELGQVEPGQRCVVFELEKITLPAVE
jgi:hypothetical protein